MNAKHEGGVQRREPPVRFLTSNVRFVAAKIERLWSLFADSCRASDPAFMPRQDASAFNTISSNTG